MLTSTAYPYEPRELIHPKCPNFFMYEIFKSDTADRLNIDNTEGFTDEMREHAASMVGLVFQTVRDVHGFTKINSWYRCEELERNICRESFQRWYNKNPTLRWNNYFLLKSHPKGEAVDLEVPGMDNDDLFEEMRSLYIYDQLIREYRQPGDPSSGWIHFSQALNQFNNREEVLHRP